MRYLLFLLFFLSIFSLQCKKPTTTEQLFQEVLQKYDSQFDFWIKNGAIYNGLDTSSKQADILIKDDLITYIGTVDSSLFKASTIIEAAGKVISPGFIDTHAHGDPKRTPEFENFLAMGVTSICLGQDGFSPEYADLNEWFKIVNDANPGVNIIPFIGHSTIRELAKVDYKPNPDSLEIAKMKVVLENNLKSGCFGMSTGLEYTPGQYASAKELAELAKIVGQYDGLIMSHMRNEDDEALEASIEELAAQGQYCKVHIAHFKSVYGKGKNRATRLLNLLEQYRKEGIKITADIYPYSASFTGIGIVFPDWAKAPNDYKLVRQNRRQELLDFLRNKVQRRNGPEATLLGTAPYAGKTLAQVSQEVNKPYEEVLLEISPDGASGAYFVMNDSLQEALIQDSNIMVCSDGSPTMRHPRGYGSFPKIIESYVQQKQLFPLGEAIRKMTSLPAQTLGLEDRGILKMTKKADLLIFDPSNIKAKANFVEPHLLAEGLDWVFVNGKVAIANEKIRSKRYGKILLKNHIN